MPRNHPTPAPGSPARRQAAEVKMAKHITIACGIAKRLNEATGSGVTLLVHLLSSLFVPLHFVLAWWWAVFYCAIILLQRRTAPTHPHIQTTQPRAFHVRDQLTREINTQKTDAHRAPPGARVEPAPRDAPRRPSALLSARRRSAFSFGAAPSLSKRRLLFRSGAFSFGAAAEERLILFRSGCGGRWSAASRSARPPSSCSP